MLYYFGFISFNYWNSNGLIIFFFNEFANNSVHLFFYQIKYLNSKNPQSCLKIFKSNNFVGLIIFFNIIIGKILMKKIEIYKRLYSDYSKKYLIKYLICIFCNSCCR